MWHGIEEEKATTLFFLSYDGQEYRFFAGNWLPLEVEAVDQAEGLQFNLLSGNYRGTLTADFGDAGSLSGTITYHHPQFPMNLSWQARRVSKNPLPDPWVFLQPQGALDWLAAVFEHGPFADESAFTEFWVAEIEPEYYPLLTQSLYTVGEPGTFTEARRTEVLSQIYGVLQERWQQVSEFYPQFRSLVEEVSGDLAKQYPWLNIPGMVVPTFGLGAFDYRPLALSYKPRSLQWHLLMDVAWMAENLNTVQSRYLIAQGLLTLSHVARHGVPDTSIRSEFAQRGIACLLASKLNYSKNPEDYLFQQKKTQAEEMEDFRFFAGKLRRDVAERAWRVRPDFFLTELRPSSYRFAFGLALDVARYYKQPRQMLEAFRYDQLRADMVSYMRSLKQLPPVKPPDDPTD